MVSTLRGLSPSFRYTVLDVYASSAILTPRIISTNSRASDLAAAAKVFKTAIGDDGKTVKIPESVKFYIAAASMAEQEAAEEAGDWQAMLDAGAVALPPSCGPCIGIPTMQNEMTIKLKSLQV